MIENQGDIQQYGTYNKIYIPTAYKSNEWAYYFNGDYITIITNQNCIQQYNTTYCNCYSYNYKNNIISNVRSCSTQSNSYEIPYESISDDLNNSIYISNKFYENKSIILLMFMLGIILAIFLTKERKHI